MRGASLCRILFRLIGYPRSQHGNVTTGYRSIVCATFAFPLACSAKRRNDPLFGISSRA